MQEDTYTAEAIRWLTDANEEQLFLFACCSNYDFNPDVIRWISTHKLCTKAVAQAIYWRLEPHFYCQYANGNIPDWALGSYQTIKLIESRWTSGAFTVGAIGFDPSHDLSAAQGIEAHAENWMLGVPEDSCIPVGLCIKTLGKLLDVAGLTADWIEGLPPHIAQIVFPDG